MTPLIELDDKALSDQRRKLKARITRRVASIRRMSADLGAQRLRLDAVDVEVNRRTKAAQKKTAYELERSRRPLK